MRKKFFFCILLVMMSLTLPTSAQGYGMGEPISMSRWRDYQRKSYFSIRFGLNVPTLYYKGTGGLAQPQSIARFNVGIVCGNKLGNGLPFYFETGLLYTEKGAELKATDETDRRISYLKYLEIPFVIKYKIDTNVDDLTVQPFFGGFVAVGVAGKTKYYGTRTTKSSFGDDRYKRFDSGIRLGCGMAYQNFYFEVAYDIGLFDISGKNYTDYHYDNFDGHIRTGNLSASVGIEF